VSSLIGSMVRAGSAVRTVSLSSSGGRHGTRSRRVGRRRRRAADTRGGSAPLLLAREECCGPTPHATEPSTVPSAVREGRRSTSPSATSVVRDDVVHRRRSLSFASGAMLGGLDWRSDSTTGRAGAPAEPSVQCTRGPPPPPRRPDAAQVQAVREREAGCPANRSPADVACSPTSRRVRGARDASASGRPRSAQQTSRRRACTQGRASFVRLESGPDASPSQRRDRRSSAVRDRRAGVRSTHGASGPERIAKARVTPFGGEAFDAARRISSGRTPAARTGARSSSPEPFGNRVSAGASRPHGPACSSSSQERTVDAVPASDSARASLSCEQRSGRGSNAVR
jgi:hypothetical protein